MQHIKEFIVKNKWTLGIIGLSLLAILVMILIRNVGNNPEDKPNVTVTLEAPAEAASGTEVIYKITFSNQDNDSIKNLKLDLVYPGGFSFKDSVPKPTRLNGLSYTLPDLESSQEGVVLIKGTIEGNVDELKTVTAIMHYNFSNFNSDFIAQASAQTKITNPDILMQFDGPMKTSNEQGVVYGLSYLNSTDKPIPAAKLILEFPQKFQPSDYTPQPTSPGVWNLGTLEPGRSGRISFQGKFIGAEIGELPTFRGKIESTGADGKSHVLASVQYSVEITPIPLVISVVGQRQNLEASADTALPGEEIEYKVSYRNNLTTAVSGVVVSAELAGGIYDLADISAENATVNGNVITWNASQVSELASVGPSRAGELSFRAKIKDPVTKANVKNLVGSVTARIRSVEFSEPFASKPLETKIITVAKLSGDVLFSSGALPPRVGQNSTYIVTISVRNSTNDIEPAELTMNMPAAIQFDKNLVNASEQGNVSYDPNTKKLTWKLGKLAAHTGNFSALRRLQFNLTINPGASSTGQPVILARNITLQGTDTFTSKSISVGLADLTTQDDPSGNGTVE